MRFGRAQTLPKELLAALLDCEDLRHLEPISVETMRAVERHVSSIYQVRIQFKQNHAMYWIKVHSGETDSAKQEFNFLRNAHSLFRDVPNLSVFRPLIYLEEFNALVSEHAVGVPLSAQVKYHESLFSPFRKKHDCIKQNFYMCGKWLAKLHEQRLPTGQSYTLEQLFEYIDIRLKRLLAEGWGLDKGVYSRIHDYFDRKKLELSGSCLSRVKTHGDYAPYNVLVSGGELTVFDPSVGQYFGGMENYCSQYEDIVHFYKWSQSMYHPFVSLRVRSELVSMFLKGYNDNSDLPVNASSAAFEIFMLKYKLLSVFDTWPSVMSKLSSKKARVSEFEKWFDQIIKRE